MFKVGDFAKIGQVSVKTLHHYDEIGLLKPIRVDTSSGYRYYVLEQLPQLNRILVLKDLGFPLEQIATFLAEPLAIAELRGMLRLRQAELKHLVQEEQARLARVEAHLQQIEKEGSVPIYDIVVKSVAPQIIVSGREIIPSTEEVNSRCEALGIKVYQLIERMGIKITGPMYTIYHDVEAYTGQDQDIDIEMGVSVDSSTQDVHFPADSGITVRELPVVEMAACLIHTGAYEGLWQAYASMLTWIERNGYQRCGSFRFIYLRTPPDSRDPVTEVQFPVEKQSSQPYKDEME